MFDTVVDRERCEMRCEGRGEAIAVIAVIAVIGVIGVISVLRLRRIGIRLGVVLMAFDAAVDAKTPVGAATPVGRCAQTIAIRRAAEDSGQVVQDGALPVLLV